MLQYPEEIAKEAAIFRIGFSVVAQGLYAHQAQETNEHPGHIPSFKKPKLIYKQVIVCPIEITYHGCEWRSEPKVANLSD